MSIVGKPVSRLVCAGLLGALAVACLPKALAQEEQYVPLPTFRAGPYASSGIPLWGGLIDYFTYVNETEGGVNGVKLAWTECETGWEADRGVECYERMKGGYKGSPVPFFNPISAPIAAALTDKSVADRIPIVTVNHGYTEASDGSVFPYNFPIMVNVYSQLSATVNYIAQREGGHDQLKGKKIAIVYIDSVPGRQTIEPLDLLADKYGFEAIQLPVALPGVEQNATWQQVRKLRPDWIYLRGWGVATPTAIRTAARFGYPVDRLIGDVWTGSEEDVRPVGAAAKGYLAITSNPAGGDFELLRRMREKVIDSGKSNLPDLNSFGSVNYNLGVVQGIVLVEALRTAQGRYGQHPVNGEQARWGLENLDVNAARLAELGATGLMQELRLSCSDHEGGGAVRVQQWDGQAWQPVSDWIQGDRELLRPLLLSKSAAYAKERGITPRDCAKES